MTSLPKVGPLKDDNPLLWKKLAESHLVERDYWIAITDPKEAEAGIGEKALANLCLLIGETYLYIIEDCDTAKKAWDNICKLIDGICKAQTDKLRGELCELKQEAGESILDYTSRARRKLMILRSVGEKIPDQDFMRWMVKGLSRSYAPALFGLRQLSRDDKTTVAELVASMQEAEELLEVWKKDINLRLALGVQESKTCTHCGKRGHLEATCWVLHPELAKCSKCRKRGHVTANCPTGNGPVMQLYGGPRRYMSGPVL